MNLSSAVLVRKICNNVINLHHKRLSSARVWIWCEKYAFPFDAFTPITIQLDVVVTNGHVAIFQEAVFRTLQHFLTHPFNTLKLTQHFLPFSQRNVPVCHALSLVVNGGDVATYIHIHNCGRCAPLCFLTRLTYLQLAVNIVK